MPKRCGDYYYARTGVQTTVTADNSAANSSVLVGLGSNQGESVELVVQALERLEEFAEGEVLASSLWRTSPVNCPPGSGDFINAAAAFQPRVGLTPEMLLQSLKALEREYGRAEVYERNAPRELDLDLLLFGREVRDTEEFTLPHPRAVDRLFVLAPAAEVLPDALWPGSGRSIAALLAQLDSDETVQQLSPAGQLQS